MIKIYADGGCTNNGTAYQDGYGSYKVEGKPTIVRKRFGNVTNNQAELMILLHVLREAVRQGVKEITVLMDSKLAVNTVMGAWQVHDEKLIPLVQECRGLAQGMNLTD